jgi:hypothetical protein
MCEGDDVRLHCSMPICVDKEVMSLCCGALISE